jgi:demethylmenaquinone methyltransferase/2-methoxy-6-polyprenyl-1,4-benzoquinol methylase
VAETIRDLTPRLIILDESRGMLLQARDKGFQAVVGEVEALPFRSFAIERILMVDTFHHLRDQARSAVETMRVLSPGGRLVMQEPDIKHRMVRWTALGEKLLLMRSRFLSPDVVRSLFADAGANVTVQDTHPHFTLIAEKESSA